MKVFLAGIGVVVGIFLVGMGVWFQRKPMTVAVSLIGGADGPTSIFVVGKVGPSMSLLLMGAGVLAVVLGVYFYWKRKK